jgi:thiosulfate/3-mercaptopyruvate sulfurtransferase
MLIDIDSLDAMGRVLFVDARIREDYEAGHIPGALHLDTFGYTNENTRDAVIAERLSDWQGMFVSVGITADDTVVFYDVGTENRCARPAFMLSAMGHERVYVLHGGMCAWIDSGRDVSSVEVSRAAVDRAALRIREDARFRERLIGIDGVTRVLASGAVKLLDVRPSIEFMGKLCVQDNPRLGHIPGARSFEWSRFLRGRENYPRQAGTARAGGMLFERFRPWQEVSDALRAMGFSDREDEVVVYCQKSHRASNTFLALERLGYVNAKVYIGSFREWCRHSSVPVEV